MSHTMKQWERLIKHRLGKITSVLENQYGLMLGRSSIEVIFTLR